MYWLMKKNVPIEPATRCSRATYAVERSRSAKSRSGIDRGA